VALERTLVQGGGTRREDDVSSLQSPLGLALLLGALTGCAPPAPALSRPNASVERAPPPTKAQPATSAASADAGPPVPLDPELLRAAEAEKAGLLADLATLVNIDSGTDDEPGLLQMAAWFARRLKELGAEVTRTAAAPSLGETVHATFMGTGSKNLMLMIHLDTVFKHGEAARRPFRSEPARAFGPGVADAKGGATIIVHALALLRRRGFAGFHTLTVLLNPDEEKGSLGSRALIGQLSSDQDAVLSFEPPEAERVIVATSGIALVELDVKGRAAHAGSAPEQGRNAALELANQVLRLQDLGDGAKGTTVNWTVMASGDRTNIIPASAHATADMRLSDPSELERVQRDAQRIISKHSVPDTQVSVAVDLRRPAFARNAASEGVAALAARIYQGLGKSLEPVSMRFGTDAGFAYRPGSAKPAVLEGLGIVGAGLHSPDEWADLDSVVPRLYLAVRLIELLSSEPASP
jgi:glutamate carboxypeptidase